MKKWNKKRVIELIGECGGIAMSHYENPVWEFKKDWSLVTKADIEIENLLARSFDAPGEHTYLIGEETVSSRSEEYIQSALRETAWIIDPIDGTAPYAHRIPTWGISIGFMESGLLKEGAVFLPVSGELFISEGTDVFYSVSKTRFPDKWDFSNLKKFEARKTEFSNGGLISVEQDIVKYGKFDFKNPVQALCCAVFSTMYLLLGGYMAYVSAARLWDLAGSLPILVKAGFKGRLASGEEVGLEVNDKLYMLSPDDPKRWCLRNRVILAGSDETIQRIAAGLTG